jgi:hypothetical protein
VSRRWLLLVYTVPTTPSRTRAYVWRELRREGALLLRDGVAALADGPAARRWAAEVAKRIGAGGGTATTATATFEAAPERRLVAAFQKEREREYAEIESACDGLLEHIAREQEHAQFTFEELEELEADLGKIQRWFADVRRRDRFQAPSARAAQRAIAVCERRLAEFGERASREDLAARAAGPLAATARRVRRRRGKRG